MWFHFTLNRIERHFDDPGLELRFLRTEERGRGRGWEYNIKRCVR
jgi:hypothetical protein